MSLMQGKHDPAKGPTSGPMAMGVCIYWSGERGFGMLRSQTHGEVFVHAKSLGNCSELTVGDVVTFSMGFDRRRQKPEATNCFKAGVGPPQGDGASDSAVVQASALASGMMDSALADAAAASAIKLQGEGSRRNGKDTERRRSRSRSTRGSGR